MNIKTILIALVAVGAATTVLIGCEGGGSGKSSKNRWVDNKISASYEKGAIEEPEGVMPPEAEIFIDASGSMKPYFTADGANMINTISEIVNLDQDGTQIYFLGNPTPYKGLVMNIISDVKKQPNNSFSTFHDFFKDAACKIDTVNTMVYLVTDGIMSVSGGDTSKALVHLRGMITNALKGHKDLAGAIFRYVGEYKGDYWNCKNQRMTTTDCPLLAEQIERPYYVVALGRKEAVRWLQTQSSKLNNPKEYFMGLHDYAGHAKSTLAYGDSAKIEDSGKDLTLILELPACLKDIDASKVKVMNNGGVLPLSVKKQAAATGTQLIVMVPWTQTLIPEPDGRLKITLTADNEIPSEWIGEWNADDDSMGPDQVSTFGLGALVTGMYNALEGDRKVLEADFIYCRP